MKESHVGLSERGSVLFAPLLFGALYLFTRVLHTVIKVPPHTTVKDFCTLEKGSHQDSRVDPATREITVPSGGVAQALINDIRVIIRDYKERPHKNQKARAIVQYGSGQMEIYEGAATFAISPDTQITAVHTRRE